MRSELSPPEFLGVVLAFVAMLETPPESLGRDLAVFATVSDFPPEFLGEAGPCVARKKASWYMVLWSSTSLCRW